MVRYASSLVDALLFIHYLAVILLEIRHLQTQFAIKVMRSPDGVSHTYTVGQLSVQRLATWCLDRYYRDFETYNPYLESVARRSSRRTTEFKVCLLCKFTVCLRGNLKRTSFITKVVPAYSSELFYHGNEDKVRGKTIGMGTEKN